MFFINLRSLKEKRNVRCIFQNVRQKKRSETFSLQGRSINRRAIVYYLRDVHDYICFSQCKGFRSHVSVSSAQNTSAERAIVSYELSRACSLYFCRCFSTGDVQESYSRLPFILPRSSQEIEWRRKRQREIILVFRRRKRDVRSSLRCTVRLR